MVKAVIFDCFGVVYADAFKDFLARNRNRLPRPVDYYYELAARDDRGEVSDEEFYGELSKVSGQDSADIKAEMHDTDCLNREVVALILELKPRYKIGMISNVERKFLQAFLDNGAVGRLFDVVVASSETGYAKPQPEIFQLGLRRLGVRPQETVFIDDSAKHVEAARQLGMQGVDFTSAQHLRTALASILPGNELL